MPDVTAGDLWASRSDYDTSAEGSKSEAARERDTGFEYFEASLETLRQRVERLASRDVILIETLAPNAYRLLKPFHVSVQACEEGFRAFFADAGLAGYGDTVPEAIWTLKDLMLATFESLSPLRNEELGPGPRRQLAVLQEYISL